MLRDKGLLPHFLGSPHYDEVVLVRGNVSVLVFVGKDDRADSRVLQLQDLDRLDVDVLVVQNLVDLDLLRGHLLRVDQVVAGNDEQQVPLLADFVHLA